MRSIILIASILVVFCPQPASAQMILDEPTGGMCSMHDTENPLGSPESIPWLTIDFEGVPNGAPVASQGWATFEPAWVALVDSDAGGSGFIANLPSPDTMAFWSSTPSSQADTRMSFASPMEAVSYHYVLHNGVATPNAYFYGPGDVLLGTIPMTVCGANICGHPCTGDPTGNYCFYHLVGFTDPTGIGISYVEFDPVGANFWGIDDLTYYPDRQPVAVAVMGVSLFPDGLADVQAKLLASGHFSKVDVYDLTIATASLATMNQYCGILTFTDSGSWDPVGFGNNLADYVDGGGGVVAAVFATAGIPIQGRWNTDNYWAIQPTSQNQGTLETMGTVHVASDPTLVGVSSFSGGSSSYRPAADSLHPDATRIADWTGTPTVPLIATRTINHAPRVDLGFYPPSSDARSDLWDASTDGDLILANALYWVAQDCQAGLFADGFESGDISSWSNAPAGPAPATCAELITNMDVWGFTATGLDLRSRTNSTLHWIGCPGNGCLPGDFYCVDDPGAPTLAFGTTTDNALRSLVDPGNAIGDTIPSSAAGCCSASVPNDVCNSPASSCNGQPVDCIQALCRALGYQNGVIVRELADNSCPEAHALNADGTDWTSDFVGSSDWGAEYLCSGFLN